MFFEPKYSASPKLSFMNQVLELANNDNPESMANISTRLFAPGP